VEKPQFQIENGAKLAGALFEKPLKSSLPVVVNFFPYQRLPGAFGEPGMRHDPVGAGHELARRVSALVHGLSLIPSD
jgi:hypothetical protein